MASKLVLVLEVNEDAATVASELAPTGVGANPYTGGPDAWNWFRHLGEWIQTQANGRGIKAAYADTAVSASTTGTFTSTGPTNGQTMTVNGVTFTAITSGTPAANEFLVVSANVSQTAANLAAAINASTTTGVLNTVGASSNLGVVTFFSIVPGPVGKNIPLSESFDNFTLAQTTLTTGGTQAHNATISAGVA